MITGYILAGGNSKRMGCDKAFLDLDGQSLIRRIIQRLQPHADCIVAIGNARNSSQLEDLPVDAVLTDLSPGWGPLMGIYTGLMHAQTSLSLFVSCDMPWIAGPVIERLLRAWHSGVPAVSSRGADGRLHPLPILCHRDTCRMAGRLLDHGALSLHQFLQEVGATVIRIRHRQLAASFRNLNTVSDYLSVA